MTATELIPESQFSAKALARLKGPQRRGMFRDLDAARAEKALLTAADSRGQARIYWLIDLDDQSISDARYLSFGDLSSHPILETWTNLIKGSSLDDALAMPTTEIEADLRDSADAAAFGASDEDPFAFISELQERAKGERGGLKVLPKPVEVERYTRKREQDWDDKDRDWLPLSLMKKIMRVQGAGDEALQQRLGRDDIGWTIDGLHDDFQIVISFDAPPAGIPTEQRPTVVAFLQEALRTAIHPALIVEESGNG